MFRQATIEIKVQCSKEYHYFKFLIKYPPKVFKLSKYNLIPTACRCAWYYFNETCPMGSRVMSLF